MKISSLMYLRKRHRLKPETADCAQDYDNEQDHGDVEHQHQVCQGHQHGGSIAAHCIGHRTERAQWGELHDQIDELEEALGHTVQAILDRRTAVFLQRQQGETEQH